MVKHHYHPSYNFTECTVKKTQMLRPFIPAIGRDPLFKEFDIHFRMGLPLKERKFVLSKLD